MSPWRTVACNATGMLSDSRRYHTGVLIVLLEHFMDEDVDCIIFVVVVVVVACYHNIVVDKIQNIVAVVVKMWIAGDSLCLLGRTFFAFCCYQCQWMPLLSSASIFCVAKIILPVRRDEMKSVAVCCRRFFGLGNVSSPPKSLSSRMLQLLPLITAALCYTIIILWKKECNGKNKRGEDKVCCPKHHGRKGFPTDSCHPSLFALRQKKDILLPLSYLARVYFCSTTTTTRRKIKT